MEIFPRTDVVVINGVFSFVTHDEFSCFVVDANPARRRLLHSNWRVQCILSISRCTTLSHGIDLAMIRRSFVGQPGHRAAMHTNNRSSSKRSFRGNAISRFLLCLFRARQDRPLQNLITVAQGEQAHALP